jgi:ADP-heptose:LPS heptosyltransferase
MRHQQLVQGIIVSKGRTSENQRSKVISTGSQRRIEPLIHSRLDGLLNNRNPKICVYRRLGGIGDVIMTTPMLKHIKRLMPNCHLVYATDLVYSNGALADIIRHNPYVDELVSFHDVSAKDFDFFTDVTATGLDKEKPGGIPLNRIDLFARQAGLDVSSDPLPDYIVSKDERDWAEKKIKEYCLPKERNEIFLVGVQLKSNDKRRTWPEGHVIELLKLLTKDRNTRVVLFSWDPSVKISMPQVFKFGESLVYTAAIIEQCDVMVAPDSALLHIAGALQKKIVGIFGPIPPESRINHYSNATALVAGMPCQHCWYRPTCGNNQTCLSNIKPKEVLKAIIEKKDESEQIRKVLSVHTGKSTGFQPDNIILVKRHHGGFGDIMMTLPGIEALKKKYPSKQVYYAIPKEFHSVAENSPFIDKILDVNIPLQNSKFSIVIDISNPCAQYESNRIRMGKKVELNRVEIFAEALGTRGLLETLRPKYYPNEEDIKWAKKFIPKTKKLKIGIVLRPASKYREWPREKFEQLVTILKDDFQCIILDKVRDFDFPGIIDGCGFPYNKAAALASQCDIIFTPNSSFLVLSAAYNIPTIVTFGPLDPDPICKMHDNITIVKSTCPYMPCWRNDVIPCRITKSTKGYSECMKTLGVETVYNAIQRIADKIK